jgi:hypothetical protein
MEEKIVETVNNIKLGLDSAEVERIARRTGFMKRRYRKIDPVVFVRAIMVMAVSTMFSLRTCSIVLGILANTVVSKVALFKRLTPHSIDFVSHVLFGILAKVSELSREVEKGVFNHFDRVLLHDSTNISLPANLSHVFPGARNRTGKRSAAVKLQTTYDYLSETFVSLRLTPFGCNDQCDSPFILKLVRMGDLVLRDLGYFSLKVFAAIERKRAYFLSRYFYRAALYDREGTRFDLLNYLRVHTILDQWLVIGSEERLAVRVVAVPVPEDISAARRRKLLQNRDKRYRPTQTQLALLGWEIFITNVDEHVWDTQTICRIYGIRWRMEIIFKSWKTHLRINAFDHPTPTEVSLIIYSRLILITLFQASLYHQLAAYTFQETGRHLSLLKAVQFFHQDFWLILLIVGQQKNLSIVLDQILKHCTYEKRNRRVNYGQTYISLSSPS